MKGCVHSQIQKLIATSPGGGAAGKKESGLAVGCFRYLTQRGSIEDLPLLLESLRWCMEVSPTLDHTAHALLLLKEVAAATHQAALSGIMSGEERAQPEEIRIRIRIWIYGSVSDPISRVR